LLLATTEDPVAPITTNMEETTTLEPSAGTKRPAEEPAAPAMTKEDSSEDLYFQSLSACIPKKPKSQSTYV
jgi:hypothetical protein